MWGANDEKEKALNEQPFRAFNSAQGEHIGTGL